MNSHVFQVNAHGYSQQLDQMLQADKAVNNFVERMRKPRCTRRT